MASEYSRPHISEDFLGPQPKFEEFGLSTENFKVPELLVEDNVFGIRFKVTKPLRMTHQLIQCTTHRGEVDISEYVLKQTTSDMAMFDLQVPLSGYYKLSIFALPVDDPSKSLPNVYNCLIHCTMACKPAYPYPKQFGQWKEGCYIFAPKILNSSSKLTNIEWKVKVPDAKDVAVFVGDDVHEFDKRGNLFTANFSLDKLRGKNAKVTLSANYGDDKYKSLLEYHIA